MSITSAEGAAMAQRLGICRVVLARELSIDDLRRIRPQTELELEVFVHGALCMSYSGQCNASFGMGGRSANRGQCAQQCRLPYELVCDDEVRDLKDRKYLLSPSDLSALDLVPELIAAGVNSLKIEGRMKSPQYVASATRQYRLAIDEGVAGRRVSPPPEQLLELESPFSRGLSQGWLAGRNLQIVDGRNSANRGICVGKVTAVRGDRVAVELTAPLRRGDGVAFPSILGEAHDQGGRVYEIFDRQALDQRGCRRPGRAGLRTRCPRTGPLAARPGALEDRRSADRPPLAEDVCRRPGPAPRAAGSDGGSRRRPQAARCRPGRHGSDVPRRVGAGT